MSPFFNSPKFNLSFALRVIYLAVQDKYKRKRPVLLLVDEITKLGSNEIIVKVLSEIGGTLSNYESDTFNALISTLSNEPFSTFYTESQRPIDWIFLEPLSNEDAFSLFPESSKSEALQLCLSDCNGHPRSLQLVQEALKYFQLGEKLSSLKYSELLTKYILKFWDTNTSAHIPEPPEEIVRAALLGKQFELSNFIPVPEGSDRKPLTLQQHLKSGYCLNVNFREEGTLVPRLSPFMLLLYATKK